MKAWGQNQNVEKNINGGRSFCKFTKAIGVEVDKGFGNKVK